MTVINRNRRQFLIGSGGFMLALPFMRSLLPSTAQAQAYKPQPRFVAWATPHGAVWGANMCPAESMLTQTTNLYSDHPIRYGTLKATVNGGRASLSQVLSASSSVLTDSLVSKLNVLRGFDVTCNISHHTGGYLGNFARTDTAGLPLTDIPTIDQVMAYSPSFYPDLSSIRKRSMHIGHVCSYGWSNPETKSGRIQPVPTSFSSKALFDDIFVQPTQQDNPRVPVVDRVLESYRKLRSGAFGDARRLSAADRQRLDDHLARLAELERRVNVVASCSGVQAPSRNVDQNSPGYYSGIFSAGNPAAAGDFYQTFNDVVAAAFMCGTSRIAVILSHETWSTFAGDWHQDVAHMAEQADGVKQGIIANAHQQFFERAFLDLASKLDVEEADGKTYLDNTLMMWSQEAGPSTHDAISMPVITAGSAGGFLKTGLYVDYRNTTNKSLAQYNRIWTNELRPGILYSQWLATALQAMGVPPSEFEINGQRGYGQQYMEARHPWTRSGNGKDAWPDRLRNDASNIVPLLKA
jgi:hypothetical protein